MSQGEGRQAVLDSGAIILPGGADVDGHSLILVPTVQLEQFNLWRVDDLASLVLHLHQVNGYIKSQTQSKQQNSNPDYPGQASSSGPGVQVSPLACVADLRQASSLATHHLVDTLETVEHQRRGAVGVVYFLKPRNKAKSLTLKKLLGLKPSKKRPRVPLFKVVLLKTIQDLYAHVDLCNVTPDFQGTRNYNHEAWMHLNKVVVKCIQTCRELSQELGGVKDKVDLLGEYDTDGQSSSQLHQLLTDLTEKYQIILSESRLPSVLTQTKQTLFSLDNPGTNAGGQLTSVHPDVLAGLKGHLKALYSELTTWSRELDESWRRTEARLTILGTVHRHRERAREIECKINEHYQPLLREHPIVGKTLSQAELYRAHFTTTLYEPAKELLSQATEILVVVQRLHSSHSLSLPPPPHSPGAEHGEGGGATLDVSDISRCLTTSIQPFTSQLQRLQQMYVSIHIFHLLFEKALNWYKKALKFLPDSMMQKCSVDSSGQPEEDQSQSGETLLYMPAEWLSAVRVFLLRHPPPKEEHLDRLDMNTPHTVDRRLRSQARSLALRLRLLQRVLSSSRLPMRLIKAVVAWKADLFGGHRASSPTDSSHLHSMLGRDLRKPQDDHLYHNSKNVHELPGSSLFMDAEDHYFRDPALAARPGLPTAASLHSDGNRLSAFQKAATSDLLVAPQGVTPVSSKSSSLGTTYTGGTDFPEEQTIYEILPPRKSGTNKGMPRTKSVEFNFNSSSTDGSVFDYDKALAGVQQFTTQPEAVLRPQTKPPRKPRRAGRVNSANSSKRQMVQPEDRGLLDQNEVAHYTSRGYSDGADETMNTFLRKGEQERYFTPGDREDPHYFARGGDGPVGLPGDDITDGAAPGAQERFVRLTFTPKHSISTATENDVYEFFSKSGDKGSSAPSQDTEVESGIDTMEINDPDDSVVKRIREISSSDISNSEKLKKVSELLTKRAGNVSASTSNDRAAGRLSHSTFDLRHVGHDMASRHLPHIRDGSVLSEENLDPDKPVEVVRKMKHNLAKSMEELNTILTQTRDDPSVHAATHAQKLEEQRFVSKLQFQPRYNTGLNPDARDSSNEREDLQSVGIEPDRRVERHGVQQVGTARLDATDSDSSKGGDHYQKLQANRLFAPQLNKHDLDPDQSTERRFRYPISSQQHTLGIYANQQQNSQRPSSLSLSGKNFISPSFLRPATSMRDLSSAGPHPMSIAYLREPDLDMEYETLQALEDLDVLTSLDRELSDVPEHPIALVDGSDDYHPSNFPQNQSLGGPGGTGHGDEARRGLRNPSSLGLDKNQLDSTTYRVELGGASTSAFQQSRSWPFSNMDTQGGDESFGKDSSKSPHGVSFSDSDGEQATPAENYLKTSERLDRLANEAERESASQDEVANTLRNIQHILDDAESQRRHLLQHMSSSGPSVDRDDEAEGSDRGRLSQTTSVDNGYGSWASKLISAPSSSSEGAVEVDGAVAQDWRKLSPGSGEIGEQTGLHRTTGTSAGRTKGLHSKVEGDHYF